MITKRLDKEPTEEALLESIESDRAGRNQDIVDFIRMLSNTEGPYSYMVDASWGDGKTFFVKSVSLVLEAMNPNIEGDAHPELQDILKELEDLDGSILPFYFNAWSNDFADDPTMALFACMAAEFDRKETTKKTNIAKGIASVIDAGLALGQIPVRISGVTGAFTGESLIDAFKSKMEIRSRIDELCATSIQEVANKLVVFIDELDRCRPDFAVRLLEQTKSLFASEDIVLVFSTDSCQLANAVKGAYGPDFSTPRFLERFFDERVTMTPVEGYAFTHEGVPLSTSDKFGKLVSEVLGSRAFSIRDMQRTKNKLDGAREFCLSGPNENLAHAVASCTILPLLVFIERDDTDLFRQITSGADLDALYEYGKVYPTFSETVEEAIGRLQCNDQHGEKLVCADMDCKTYMHHLCMLVYGRDESGPEYREARGLIGGFAFSPFDQRVYKRLKFD